MEWTSLILRMLGIVIVVVVVYNFLKIYVLDKIKINKWLVLALSAVFFILPGFFVINNEVLGTWIQYLFSIIFVILFMWFLDLAGWTNKSRGRKSTSNKNTSKYAQNKPKAKPSRVDKTNMEVIQEKKNKKNMFKKK
ncbi:hypothetical protein [Clostridium sp. DL1XJH146]